MRLWYCAACAACLAAVYALAVAWLTAQLAEGVARWASDRLFAWITAAEATGRRYLKLLEPDPCAVPSSSPSTPPASP